MRKLTMLFSALTISTSLIANQPSKNFEIKIEPIPAITDGVAVLGIEAGHSNFGFGLDFSMLFGNGKFGYQNQELNFINKVAFLEDNASWLYQPFKTSGYSIDINILYYLNENRRGGFNLISGIVSEAGTDYLLNKETKSYNYKKNTKTIYRVYIKIGLGHKLELTNNLFISNSIELPLIVYDSQISDLVKNENNKEILTKSLYEAYRASKTLSSFRVKLLEFRLAF